MFYRKFYLKSGSELLRRYFFSSSIHTISIIMEKPPLKVTISDRLSSLVHPVNYKLILHPDLVTGSFKGSVKIDVDVKEDKKYIQLHSKFLDISDLKVYKGEQEVPVLKYLEVKQIEQLLIHFENVLSSGNYQISLDFSGDLTRNIVGFYLSRLKHKGTMVASKFQPTYARQAFPCFDEPEFKATYDITLVKPPTHIALSNMNEVSKSIDQDTKMESVTFATSVPMSTYLACFVVCDFAHKEAEINANGIGENFKLRTFAQNDQMHKIDFALDIGKRATEYYINYYEVPFPLPKLDMIAIPDYQSGATEHWGLITYRETSFLVDPATASAHNKYNVANTIAHELAHMWFGNLVTLKWWDDLWLNEGFATYMQVKALNAIEPTWTMLELFLTKTLHSVLVTDAKLSSHPIVQTVDTPDQITAIFDSISYNKGASVLRMLEGFVGEENFRKGVSDYLKKHEFGNTVTQDLLNMLEKYFKKSNPDLNLTYIVGTWTRQMGYPVLTVAKGDAPNTYVITQSRFLLDPKAKIPNDSPYDYRWFIPITYTTNQGTNENIFWFPDTADNVKLTLKEGEKWLKINRNQIGYYRVNYPLDMWEELIRQLKDKAPQLSISDRAHLINDVFALAQAKRVPYDLALNLTTYLTVEEDFVPWETASSVFAYLSNILIGTMAYDDLQKYTQRLVEPLYAKQSWKKSPEGVIERLLRFKILGLATRSRLPQAEDKVRTLFLNWLNNHGTANAVEIEPDIRDLVYYHGMKPATVAEWEKLWKVYLKEEDAQEQAKLRHALAAPRDTVVLRRYLLLAWDEKNIRGQDYLNVLHSISVNPSGADLVWGDVRARWPQLVDRFTLNSRYLGNMLPAITADFNTDLKLKEMEAFFSEYPEAGAGEAARRRALETVKDNIRWMHTNQKAVADWLKANTS